MLYGLHFFPNFNPFTQETKQKSFNLLSSVIDMNISRQISDATIAKNCTKFLFNCILCVCVCVYMLSLLVMPDSSRPHGRQPTRLLCPRNFLDKNTGVDCHFLLQRIFLTQGSNTCLMRLLHWPPGKPFYFLLRSELEFYHCCPVDSMPAESQ